MRIIGVYNIKGGVGKTATAVNLAFLSAQEGHRTLIWDLDPQAAATFYLRIKPKIKGGSRKMIQGKRALDGLIKGTDFENLDLLPADFSYRNMDLMLGERKKPARQLLKLLRRRPWSSAIQYFIKVDQTDTLSIALFIMLRPGRGLRWHRRRQRFHLGSRGDWIDRLKRTHIGIR